MASADINFADVPKYNKVLKPDTLVKDKYYVLEKLGDGCYGEVYLVQDITSQDGDIFALKSIQKKHFKGNRKLPYMLDKEAKIHKTLNHPNIVQLYDYFEDDKYVFFLLEYITPGELFNILYEKDQFGEEEAASIIYQTTQALMCCQANSVIHRDLKPENLLMASDGTIKLADFGWATYKVGESVVGSVHYNAPEMLRYQRYDYRSDIWSLGVLVYELLCGEQPFKGRKKVGQSKKDREKDTERMIKNRVLRKTKYYQRLSPGAKDLIESILHLDPKKRPSYAEILRHPWMLANCPQINKEAAERLRLQKLEEESADSSDNSLLSTDSLDNKEISTFKNSKSRSDREDSTRQRKGLSFKDSTKSNVNKKDDSKKLSFKNIMTKSSRSRNSKSRNSKSRNSKSRNSKSRSRNSSRFSENSSQRSDF